MKNGSSIIDLSPLIHRTGGYEAYDESEDDASGTNPDFYINICQPLNPMHGLPCPAGAAVCKVPVDGAPIVSVGNPRAETVFVEFATVTFMLCPSLPVESYSRRNNGHARQDCACSGPTGQRRVRVCALSLNAVEEAVSNLCITALYHFRGLKVDPEGVIFT